MERFHALPWEERPAIISAFTDRRLKQIGKRLLYLERPDLLADATRGEFDRAVAHRISVDDLERPCLTLSKAIVAIDDLLADANPVEMAFLHDHRAHLAERLAEAQLGAQDSVLATFVPARGSAE
jgi:exodeoxyribonuclease I